MEKVITKAEISNIPIKMGFKLVYAARQKDLVVSYYPYTDLETSDKKMNVVISSLQKEKNIPLKEFQALVEMLLESIK